MKYLGATTYGEDAPARVLELSDHFRILQIAYNVLDRRLEEQILPLANKSRRGPCRQIGFPSRGPVRPRDHPTRLSSRISATRWHRFARSPPQRAYL